MPLGLRAEKHKNSALATGRVALRSGKTFAGAAVPVPVSGERPARVLAGGTQSQIGLHARRGERFGIKVEPVSPHFVFRICACLRAGTGPSCSLSSGLFVDIPPENAERRTSEAKKLRPSVGTMMICNLSERRSAIIF